MHDITKHLTRRELLVRGGYFVVAAATGASGFPLSPASLATVDVAYAGSMGSMMEGPIKTAVATKLQLEFRGRAQGSNALAQLIAGGSISPDVFVPVTAGPMLTVLRAGRAASAQPIASTEMVIAYSPRSRFAAKLNAAAEGKTGWWKVLQEPGLRFGRTDPITDPQGRNIIFSLMLAAKLYRQPKMVEKILGPIINPKQIFSEPTVQARLQSGELDAASAYKIQPGPFHLPFIELPEEVNLRGDNPHFKNFEISLSLGDKSYYPEPLIYYAAVLNDAANRAGGISFTHWLRGAEAQQILRKYSYDPPGGASALHA